MLAKSIPLVIKNLLRSKTRLLATAGGCMVAAFVVAFFLAAQDSFSRMLDTAGQSANLIVTQKDRYWPTSSLIPDEETRRIQALPQVAEVMPVKLLMTSCQAATDMIAIHGVDKDLFTMFRDYDLDPATLESFRADKSGALVGNRIAERYKWKVGQHVTLQELDGVSFTIRGLFTTNGGADDFLILAGRRFLQEAAGEQGISNHVLVKLKPGADPSEASRAIAALPLTIEITAQPEEAHLATALDQLRDLVEVSKIVIGVIVGVILIAMGNAISMVTRERAREFGILRTLGFGKGAILALVMGEGLFQSLAGALLGCALVQALVSANIVESVSTCGFTVNFLVSAKTWAWGIVAITLAGLCGCLAPAWRAAQLDIVTAIRRAD